jgi:hypothetical protein
MIVIVAREGISPTMLVSHRNDRHLHREGKSKKHPARMLLGTSTPLRALAQVEPCHVKLSTARLKLPAATQECCYIIGQGTERACHDDQVAAAAQITPSSLPTAVKAAMAVSSCCRSCAAGQKWQEGNISAVMHQHSCPHL